MKCASLCYLRKGENLSLQGHIQDFQGGGGKRCDRTHITSAMPEVPYGRGPGPAQGPWKLKT